MPLLDDERSRLTRNDNISSDATVFIEVVGLIVLPLLVALLTCRCLKKRAQRRRASLSGRRLNEISVTSTAYRNEATPPKPTGLPREHANVFSGPQNEVIDADLRL